MEKITDYLTVIGEIVAISALSAIIGKKTYAHKPKNINERSMYRKYNSHGKRY